MTDVAAPPRPRRVTLAAKPSTGKLLITVVLAVAVLRLPSFVHQLYDPDEAAIAVQGMGLVRGGTLYTDVIDRKPPLASWLYAVSFRITDTHDLRPLHGVAAVELVAAALIIAWELRRRIGGSAAWWGALLFVFGAVAAAPRDAQAANFSHLALMPAVGAIVVARRPGRWTPVWAGILLGLATLTRQTWAIGLVPAAFAAWYHGGRQWRRPIETIAATLLTVASIGLIVPFGAFFHWTFSGNGSLLFGLSQATDVFKRWNGSWWLFFGGHVALIFLLIWRGSHRDDLDLWLWLVTGLLMVVAGFRFFGHYWLQVLPPLCLLAAPAIVRCGRILRAFLATTVLVAGAIFFALAWYPDTGQTLPNPDPVARVIRERTTRNQRVAVWGSYPELYWKSNRLPAAGLILTDFVVGKSAGRIEGPQTLRDATPGARDDYLDIIEAHPPELFVDTSTAGIRGYGKYPVTVLPGLAKLLRTRYHRIAVVEGVTIYQRTG